MKPVVVFLLLLPLFSYSNQRHDSLLQQFYNTSLHDTDRLWAMQNAIIAILYQNPDSAISLAQKQREFIKRTNIAKWKAANHNIYGAAASVLGNMDLARSEFEKAVAAAREIKDNLVTANSLNNLSRVYMHIGDHTNALKVLLESLAIKEKMGNKESISNTLNNIGIIHYERKEYRKALEYYKRAYQLDSLHGSLRSLTYGLINMGNVYMELGNTKRAKSYFFLALELEQKESHVLDVASTYQNLAGAYYKEDLLDSSEYYYTRSIAISKEQNDTIGLANSLQNYGQLLLKKQETNKALSVCSQAYRLIKAKSIVVFGNETCQCLVAAHEKLGRSDSALFYFREQMMYKDSVFNEQNTKEITQREMQYEFSKQQLQDSLAHAAELKRKEDLAATEQKRQNIIITSVATGLGLVLLFSVFLFNRFRVTQRQKLIIEEKNKEITDSITYARRIQDAILPPLSRVQKHLKECFVLYQPKDIVAGDFYWMEPQGNNVIFAAADCTGHGVPGAMVSVVCHNALNRSVREFGLTDPGQILDKTRELVIETFEKSDNEVKDGMDIALCNLNLKTKQLKFAGAGNGLVVIKQGVTVLDEVIYVKADKQPIGLYAKPTPFTSHTLQLEEGDCLYIFSDGFPDQFGGPKGKKFMYKPFRRLLLENVNKPMAEQSILLNQAFEEWRGSLEQIDDVCVIGVRV